MIHNVSMKDMVVKVVLFMNKVVCMRWQRNSQYDLFRTKLSIQGGSRYSNDYD